MLHTKLTSTVANSAVSTTFITAWIYADVEPVTNYEPGVNSEKIGEDILEAVDRAALAHPAGSTLRRRLEVRYDYISYAVARQDYFFHDLGWAAWWSNVGANSELSSVQKNQTGVADVVPKNSSGPHISTLNAANEECDTDLSSSVLVECKTSTNRRNKKRSRRIYVPK